MKHALTVGLLVSYFGAVALTVMAMSDWLKFHPEYQSVTLPTWAVAAGILALMIKVQRGGGK